MKKWISLLLTICMLTSLCACGSSSKVDAMLQGEWTYHDTSTGMVEIFVFTNGSGEYICYLTASPDMAASLSFDYKIKNDTVEIAFENGEFSTIDYSVENEVMTLSWAISSGINANVTKVYTQTPYGKAELTRQQSISTLQDYVSANGSSFGGVSVLKIETSDSSSLQVLIQNEVVVFTLSYDNPDTQQEQRTYLYLRGYEGQKDGHYFAFQTNKNAEGVGVSFGTHILPYEYTAESTLEIENFKYIMGDSALSSEDFGATEEMVATMKSGINLTLELFSTLLENELSLTLSDFGFNNFILPGSTSP